MGRVFGKEERLLDVKDEFLPEIEIHDWSKPNAPLIKVRTADVIALNAHRLSKKAEKAEARYLKLRNEVETLEQSIPNLKSPTKKKRAKAKLKSLVDEMQTAEADSQRLRSSVKSTETVSLTEDVILAHRLLLLNS